MAGQQDHRETIQMVLDFALSKMPHEYTGKKNWEKTKRVWAGVKVRRNGLKLSTKRRYRELRHGLQTKYSVSFPKPNESVPADWVPPITANVKSVAPTVGDSNHAAGYLIDCELQSPLNFSARVERWRLGVQWSSVEITGHMTVRLNIKLNLSSYGDYSVIPPAIVIDPEVLDAKMELAELHVDRISKIGGEVAEQSGDMAKKIAEEVFMEEWNQKLPAKLNKAIDKKSDRLRISIADWITTKATLPRPESQQDQQRDEKGKQNPSGLANELPLGELRASQ